MPTRGNGVEGALIAVFSVVCAGIAASDASASGSHPPPPMSRDDYLSFKASAEDTNVDPRLLARLIDSTAYRQRSKWTDRFEALLRAITDDPEREITVRLAAALATDFSGRSKNLSKDVVMLLRQALEADAPAASEPITKALCGLRVGKSTTEKVLDELVLGALRHGHSAPRVAGLSYMGAWRIGKARYAPPLRAILKDPYREEFRDAVMTVMWCRGDLAAELTTELRQIAGAGSLALDIRAAALGAVDGPYTDRDLRQARRILGMNAFRSETPQSFLIGQIKVKASGPAGIFCLLEVARWSQSSHVLFNSAMTTIGLIALRKGFAVSEIDYRLDHRTFSVARNTSARCGELLSKSTLESQRLGAVVVLGLVGPNALNYVEAIRKFGQQSSENPAIAMTVKWALRRIKEGTRDLPELPARYKLSCH